MKAGVAVLDERIKASGKDRESQGKIVIGTVKGDIHDIGKSVVASMLQANGYDVVDLGIDVDDAAFVRAAQEHKADCVAMSSLLTLNIDYMGVVVEKLKEAGYARPGEGDRGRRAGDPGVRRRDRRRRLRLGRVGRREEGGGASREVAAATGRRTALQNEQGRPSPQPSFRATRAAAV